MGIISKNEMEQMHEREKELISRLAELSAEY
jgi:hypothetical protein